MKILAIDTALPAVSVCVQNSDEDGPEIIESIPMLRGHAEVLIPVIERVVRQSKGGFDTIDRVAVTVGPGSFTGIRVGISAAKGIGLARNIPVVGVSTLAAFVAPYVNNQAQDVVACSIDARHGQVYIQAFSPGGRPLITPRAMLIRDAIRALGSGPVKLVGSAAPLMAIEAWSMGLRTEVISESLFPDIVYVARLGIVADPAKSPVRPLYLKPVDAVPQGDPKLRPPVRAR